MEFGVGVICRSPTPLASSCTYVMSSLFVLALFDAVPLCRSARTRTQLTHTIVDHSEQRKINFGCFVSTLEPMSASHADHDAKHEQARHRVLTCEVFVRLLVCGARRAVFALEWLPSQWFVDRTLFAFVRLVCLVFARSGCFLARYEAADVGGLGRQQRWRRR